VKIIVWALGKQKLNVTGVENDETLMLQRGKQEI